MPRWYSGNASGCWTSCFQARRVRDLLRCEVRKVIHLDFGSVRAERQFQRKDFYFASDGMYDFGSRAYCPDGGCLAMYRQTWTLADYVPDYLWEATAEINSTTAPSSPLHWSANTHKYTFWWNVCAVTDVMWTMRTCRAQGVSL